jgi:hypothetical protein
MKGPRENALKRAVSTLSMDKATIMNLEGRAIEKRRLSGLWIKDNKGNQLRMSLLTALGM